MTSRVSKLLKNRDLHLHGSFKTGLNTADAHSVKTLTKKNREVNRIPETDTGF